MQLLVLLTPLAKACVLCCVAPARETPLPRHFVSSFLLLFFSPCFINLEFLLPPSLPRVLLGLFTRCIHPIQSRVLSFFHSCILNLHPHSFFPPSSSLPATT
ncbi:hypothetical protein B0T10DRAFT_485058 [Thelonectria olida]|uniref:Uncharacterized protein n=1 Tax=Thelonectria olida TaxID=1576542 RepID=A0A9P8W9B8_9HYPO|nr:hypothetical protein B0T10DRAFT_485058 [Thelonectria olida]